MGIGVTAWDAYLPYWRLSRETIGAALGTPAGRGTRAVASYDEDPTSMAVEAARRLTSFSDLFPTALVLATAAPPYLDKTNATAVHAALALAPDVPAYDFGGSVRSGIGAVRAAMGLAGKGSALVVLSDVRTGLPGGGDERDGGDAAAAFAVGENGVVAEVVGVGHATEEFLDRWRLPGATESTLWEERFSEQVYVPLAEAAVTDALKSAGLAAVDLDHVVVAGPHLRSVRRVAVSIGARPDAAHPDLVNSVGNCGTAHLGLLLCDVLDRAAPDQTILAISVADGADALVLRTTPALTAAQSAREHRRAVTVAEHLTTGRSDLPYNTYATWRGLLHREPPRRPDPEAPAAPPARRMDAWKFGFTGSRCEACGTRHLPPARVCVSCNAFDQMAPERLADVRGTVATFTVDRLAYSLSPPVVAAVIDFDGGGRFSCELTDVDPSEIRIGLRVEMTFRKLYTAEGVHNYFWKAKPVRATEEASV